MLSGVGTCTLTATQGGNDDYSAAAPVAHDVAAAKKAQTITFAAPASPQTFGDTFHVDPTASSGLDVALSGTAGECSVASVNTGGFDVTMLSGVGTCTLTATQGGNDDYSAAAPVAHDVAAAKKAQTITFAPLANKTLGNADFTLTATGGGSGNAVTFASTTSGVCTVSGATVHLVNAGTCTITADEAGSINYLAATEVIQSFKVLYLSAGTCNGDAGHVILQPINATTPFSLFKQGSTVPAKFRVCDANGHSIGTPGVVAKFQQISVSAGVPSVVSETVDSTTPDTAFRWDATAQQWIFNMSTKALNGNSTYIWLITLNDGSTIQFQFSLK
jgi:hypothetical protein